MNVLDLFCGCGGISLGFKLSGFNIIGGVDIDPDSIKTFQRNFPESKSICENLLDYSITIFFNLLACLYVFFLLFQPKFIIFLGFSTLIFKPNRCNLIHKFPIFFFH